MTTRITVLKRHIFSLIAAVLLVMLMQPLTASADDKEYRVDAANFNIEFAPNGDACITEIWDVTFTKGSFTRFYKDIYNAFNQLEYISDVQVQSCLINGQEAERQYSTTRNDMHYYLEPSSDRYTIHWFHNAQNESVNYQITYVIPHALKLDENNRAVFCYRFIGTSFPKQVGHVTAFFDLPDGTGSSDVTVSYGDCTQDGDDVFCEGTNGKGIYKIRLETDAAAFGDLTRIVDVQVPEKPQPVNRGSRSTITGIEKNVIVGFFGVAGFLVFLGFVPAILGKLKLKKDPDCLMNAAERIDRTSIPFSWYLMLPKVQTVVNESFAVFYLGLFDLAKQGYLAFGENGLLLKKYVNPAEQDSVQEKNFLSFRNMLKQNFRYEELADCLQVSYQDIHDTLSEGKASIGFFSQLSAWQSGYHKDLPNSELYQSLAASGTLEQLKKDLKLWRNTAQYTKYKSNPYECIGIIRRTCGIKSFDVLTMMHCPDRTAVSPHSSYDDDLCNMICFFTSAATSYSSDSSSGSSGGSGCSSCSSCSSCSGCGGGGAD